MRVVVPLNSHEAHRRVDETTKFVEVSGRAGEVKHVRLGTLSPINTLPRTSDENYLVDSIDLAERGQAIDDVDPLDVGLRKHVEEVTDPRAGDRAVKSNRLPDGEA